MTSPSFPLTEALADLKDLGIACGKEALHAQLRRRMQKQTPCPDRVDVALRSRRWDEGGGFDFQIVFFDEVAPDGLDHCGSSPESRLFGG